MGLFVCSFVCLFARGSDFAFSFYFRLRSWRNETPSVVPPPLRLDQSLSSRSFDASFSHYPGAKF